MSEEMVMRTSDSPAEASDNVGLSSLLTQDSSYANEPETAPALNTAEDASETLDFSWLDDIASEPPDPQELIRQKLTESLSAQKTPENVPYDRFREVNEQAKAAKDIAAQYEKWADVIQALESDGYTSGEQLRNAWAQQQQQANEDQIRQKYQTMSEANLLSEDAARISADYEIQRMKYEELLSQVEAQKRSQSLEQAFREYPYARRGEQIVNNLVARGVDPIEAVSYVHTELANMAESLVPELASMFEAQKQVPIPIDTSESAQPVVQEATPTRGLGGVFSRLMGIGRNNNGI
jgi:DNA-binding TFAR19-related protein (PDSD5 family)